MPAQYLLDECAAWFYDSVDISCGPTAPAGFEANWIPTVSGKSWFAYFRLYEPTESYFDKSWPLGDFEKSK